MERSGEKGDSTGDPHGRSKRIDTRAAHARLDREILALAAVVILGTSMTVLDLTIVNVAVPTRGRDLHTSIATIQWVLTGYMLASLRPSLASS